ncbi:hypothetical protein ABFX02_01G077400 [Erythranthe guttata]
MIPIYIKLKSTTSIFNRCKGLELLGFIRVMNYVCFIFLLDSSFLNIDDKTYMPYSFNNVERSAHYVPILEIRAMLHVVLVHCKVAIFDGERKCRVDGARRDLKNIAG